MAPPVENTLVMVNDTDYIRNASVESHSMLPAEVVVNFVTLDDDENK